MAVLAEAKKGAAAVAMTTTARMGVAEVGDRSARVKGEVHNVTVWTGMVWEKAEGGGTLAMPVGC
jgi:hypothetical protein